MVSDNEPVTAWPPAGENSVLFGATFACLSIQRHPTFETSSNMESIMAESFKDKVEDAGHKIAEKATEVGHKVGEKAEEAADWAKEKAHQAGNRIEETAQKVKHKVATLAESKGAVGSTADIQRTHGSLRLVRELSREGRSRRGRPDQADQERQPRRTAPPDPAGVGGQGS